MAKKKKHPEHINLERWLISYADFITLLFATFVVLYALSQVDSKDFKALEASIQQAFSAPSVMQGSNSVMDGKGGASSSIFDQSQGDAMIAPLMMEYMSQKYEDEALQEIAQDIQSEVKTGELSGVEAVQNEKGISIRLKGDYLFKPASAEITPAAKKELDKIGAIIIKKFILHNMRIEGHTDNQPFVSKVYPSNWELSSARASSVIRYFIARFKFMPSVFTAVGFADTRPIANNAYSFGRSKNRRVEIFILKNRFNSQEQPQNEIMKMNQDEQEKMQAYRLQIIGEIQNQGKSPKTLNKVQEEQHENAVINTVYTKEIKRLSKETNALDAQTRQKITGQGVWLKPPAQKTD